MKTIKHTKKATRHRGAKKKVSFRLKKPKARSVAIVGTFTEWETNPIPLLEVSPGLWQTEVMLPSGRHEYLFLADGTDWLPDPEAETVAENPWGGINSVVEVEFQASD